MHRSHEGFQEQGSRTAAAISINSVRCRRVWLSSASTPSLRKVDDTHKSERLGNEFKIRKSGIADDATVRTSSCGFRLTISFGVRAEIGGCGGRFVVFLRVPVFRDLAFYQNRPCSAYSPCWLVMCMSARMERCSILKLRASRRVQNEFSATPKRHRYGGE